MFHDPRFVFDLRLGRTPGEVNRRRALDAIAAGRPPHEERPRKGYDRSASREEREATLALLRDMLAFCERNRVGQSMLGRHALNSAGTIARMKGGAVLRPSTRAAVRRYLSTHDRKG